MSDREKLPELIDRFNSGELSGEELTAFLEMLKANPRLREEIKLDKELNEALAEEDILELRQKIKEIQGNRQKKKGPDLRIFLLAASLLLLIGVEVLLFLNYKYQDTIRDKGAITRQQPGIILVPETSMTEVPVIAGDSASKQKHPEDVNRKTRLASNFRTNPAFEDMIGATRNAGNFRLEAPAPGYRFPEKEKISFTWKMDGDDGINLTIMDNEGTIVHEARLENMQNYSMPPRSLKKGLYYFKILRKDEILFFGKFIVK